VKENKPINPVHISLFGAVRIMLETNGISHLIQNLLGALTHREEVNFNYRVLIYGTGILQMVHPKDYGSYPSISLGGDIGGQ
jgi:hypothetical protein